MRTLLSTIPLITVLSLFLSCSINAREIQQTLDAKNGGNLYLKTDVGRLDIRSHDSDTVELKVSIVGDNADDFNVEYDSKSGDVTIIGKMKRQGSWGWSGNIRAEFIVTVPENYNIDLHTSGGSIDIEDLNGAIDAHTSGGSIEVGNITGNVELKTSGGSITTKAIHGKLNAHTSGGSIRTTIAEQLTEDAELSTSGGSITAYLIPDIKIDIDASTSGGKVRTDFDVSGRVNKKSIRGEINGGGPRLELHTSGGSISLKSL